MGGLIAAIQAQDCGAQAFVIEKSLDVNQSSTAIAGGGFAIYVEPYGEYSQEELIQAFLKTSDGQCDFNLVRTFVTRLAADFTWLKDDLGLSLAPNPARKGGFLVVGRGAAIPPFLEKVAREKGVDFQFNTTAKRLLTNEHGRVLGMEATTPSGLRSSARTPSFLPQEDSRQTRRSSKSIWANKSTTLLFCTAYHPRATPVKVNSWPCR